MRRIRLLSVLLMVVFGTSGLKSFAADTLKYLALGDSYTIGRLVPVEDSFPYQLTAKLKSKGFNMASPTLIAQNGWRTDELIKGIAGSGVKNQFDVVTLLIGVNNQFQGFDVDTYRAEFAQLLNTAIAYARGNKARVFVLSIPDWGVTPFGALRGPAKIAVQIDLYNKINREESEKAGVNYIDITDITRDVGDDLAYLASDHLHPSAKLYRLWVNRLDRRIRKVLEGLGIGH